MRTNTFTHDGVEYDLDIVWNKTKTQRVLIKLDDLKWLIEEAECDPDMDPRSPNMLRPILVVWWNGRICCVDGYHRMCNAIELGWDYLLGQFVPDEIMERAKIK